MRAAEDDDVGVPQDRRAPRARIAAAGAAGGVDAAVVRVGEERDLETGRVSGLRMPAPANTVTGVSRSTVALKLSVPCGVASDPENSATASASASRTTFNPSLTASMSTPSTPVSSVRVVPPSASNLVSA